MFTRSTTFTVPGLDGGVNDIAIDRSLSTSSSSSSIVAVVACENGAVVGFDERMPSEGRCAFEVPNVVTTTREEANCVVWGVDGSSSTNVFYFARGSTVFETDIRRLGGGSNDAASVVRTFDEASDGVNGVDIDAKGELLAACDDEGEIIVYDLKSGGVKRSLKGHTGCVTSVRFRRAKRGASECVSAATDCKVMKWDVTSKPVPVRTWEMRAMRGVDDLIREESVANDDENGTEKETSDSARAFNPPMAHSVAVFDGTASDENVPGARRVLASACGDGTIAVIDMDHPGGGGSGGSKKKKSTSTGVFRSGKAECVRLGASNSTTSAVDASIRHTAAATCAEFAPWNPRGDVIVSGGTDRRLIAWNWVSAAASHHSAPESAESVQTGALACVKRSRKINALAFSHVFPRLAVADTGPSIVVFDVGS